jgi:dynein heavy chain
LEEDLLQRLANAQGDILDDIELVENLEKSKMLSVEISEKVAIAKETQLAIYEASEAYRPAANRGALVFFLMNELFMIHSFYRFSLDSFIIVVKRAIDIVAEAMKPVKKEKGSDDEEEEDPEPEEDEEEGE